MIRALVIGTEAPTWSKRLAEVATASEFEAARLPAAAIRAFERSPADVVVLCGDPKRGRLTDVLEALRERPLGRLVPCVAVGDVEIEEVDAQLSEDADPVAVIDVIAELVGLTPDQLMGAPAPAVETDAGALTEGAIERKLRQVRHETYFEVLEVGIDVSPADLRAAFASLWDLYEPRHIPTELEHRFSSELAEVRDGLEDAFAVLGNDKLRAAYSDPRRQ